MKGCGWSENVVLLAGSLMWLDHKLTKNAQSMSWLDRWLISRVLKLCDGPHHRNLSYNPSPRANLYRHGLIFRTLPI